ncbi:MAG: hypothetical protein ACYTG3_14625 [Planctomycetota bacterium]|jgi:hypothetical protein
MRQELIDLLLGELEPDADQALRERLRNEPALAKELGELEALFALMRRGEEIEPSPELRRALVAEAERRTAPPLWIRLRQLPEILAYRFQSSLRFRVATVSLGIHLVAMVVLSIVLIERPRANPGSVRVVWQEEEAPIQRPADSFVARLTLRRLPHEPRLKTFGVPGQAQAIEQGLETVLARQQIDGSFDTLEETAYAALALLAEGNSSVTDTRRGRALRAAVRHLLDQADAGAVHGALLAALVEDYGLAYEDLREEERTEYVRAIRGLTLRVGDDAISREGLALAALAGFPVPAGRDLGAAGLLLGGDRGPVLDGPPSREAATAVLARGHLSLDRGRVRAWVFPLFEQAVADVGSGRVSAVVVLTLQAPYRL